MDVTQIITDPNLCTQVQALQGINPTQFVGLAGAPAVEQAVQYLKEQWALPTKMAPLASVGLGVLLNIGLAAYLGTSLIDGVALGAATGVAASFWYVMSK
jgi:hypothetical protein